MIEVAVVLGRSSKRARTRTAIKSKRQTRQRVRFGAWPMLDLTRMNSGFNTMLQNWLLKGQNEIGLHGG